MCIAFSGKILSIDDERFAVIGTVAGDRRGRVVLETLIGCSREVDLPTGELVPRICRSIRRRNFSASTGRR
jgi:hydrogenase maturation factor